MNKKYTRRAFLYKNISGSATLVAGGWLLSAFKLIQTTPLNNSRPTNQNIPKEAAQQIPQNGGTANDQKPCEDLTGVATGELDKRKKFAYVNVSPLPDSRCGNCKLFLPPNANKPCGACMLFKGPVLESGYCTYWAPVE